MIKKMVLLGLLISGSAYSKTTCFDGDICLVSISQCRNGGGALYPFFKYIKKTVKECITYDGTTRTLSETEMKSVSADSTKIEACEDMRSSLIEVLTECS